MLERVGRQQRLEQVFPVRSEPRGPMACNVLEIAPLLAVVRDRTHGPLRIEPFDASRAIRALARVVPEAGIRAAEAEHRVLRALERDVVDVDLERQQQDVRVEEEIEIDMARR